MDDKAEQSEPRLDHGEEHPREKGFGWAGIAFGLLLLLLGYVLSTGPVIAATIMVYGFSRPVVDLLEGFYFPLVWVSERNEAIGGFFEWYVEWWYDFAGSLWGGTPP